MYKTPQLQHTFLAEVLVHKSNSSLCLLTHIVVPVELLQWFLVQSLVCLSQETKE